MGKKRKNRSKTDRKEGCEYCENMVACGEGDFLCLAGEEPRTVLTGYSPAEDYFWFGGRRCC